MKHRCGISLWGRITQSPGGRAACGGEAPLGGGGGGGEGRRGGDPNARELRLTGTAGAVIGNGLWDEGRRKQKIECHEN